MKNIVQSQNFPETSLVYPQCLSRTDRLFMVHALYCIMPFYIIVTRFCTRMFAMNIYRITGEKLTIPVTPPEQQDFHINKHAQTVALHLWGVEVCFQWEGI